MSKNNVEAPAIILKRKFPECSDDDIADLAKVVESLGFDKESTAEFCYFCADKALLVSLRHQPKEHHEAILRRIADVKNIRVTYREVIPIVRQPIYRVSKFKLFLNFMKRIIGYSG